MSIIYTKARPEHIDQILALIQPHVEVGAVLQRTSEDLLSHLHNFFVATVIERGQRFDTTPKVVGCVALRDFGDGLEEIRTLCVDPEYGQRGIASALIDLCFDMAIARHTKQLFALSLRPNLFMRKGFRGVEMESLPNCVWADDEVSSPDEKALILLECDQYIPE